MAKTKCASIRCPTCGNDGQPGGPWERNWRTPFKAVERALSSWPCSVTEAEDGSQTLVVDADSEMVDPESGEGVQIECNACFNVFPVPEGVEVSFE